MLDWQDANNGSIPDGAQHAGVDTDKLPLYVARARIPGRGNGWQPGKIRVGLGAAYIPFGGAEVSVDSYQVLMNPSIYFPTIAGAPEGEGYEGTYPPETGGWIPPGYPGSWGYAYSEFATEPHAILCGQDVDGSPLFCAVVSYEGVQPGKAGWQLGGANIGYGGDEMQGLSPYGVLCDESFGWEMGNPNAPVPPGSVPCGTDDDGGTLYLARAIDFHWLEFNPPVSEPQGSTGLQLGKIRADGWGLQGACIPYAGQEHHVPNCQVLTAPSGKSLVWVEAANGEIPDGALALGCEGNGMPLFAARGFIGSALQVGKIRPGFEGAYIPYEGNEVSVTQYAVLVAP